MNRANAKIVNVANVEISIEVTMAVWEWELALQTVHDQNNPSYQLIYAISSAVAKLKREAFEEFNVSAGE